jgi:hypothetical protein
MKAKFEIGDKICDKDIPSIKGKVVEIKVLFGCMNGYVVRHYGKTNWIYEYNAVKM